MSTLKAGDVVRMKSGGPLMTIAEIGRDGTCLIAWFDGNGRQRTDGAKLAALRKECNVSNWQPISTAPAGEEVLVFVPNGDMAGGSQVYKGRLSENGYGWMTTAWACGRRLPDDMQPTLWMPIPEPEAP